jgi:hypothetical protein
MSGDRYLLDANAIVSLLRGYPSLLKRLKEAAWVGISILEFLAFPDLSEGDIRHFRPLTERVNVIGIDRTRSERIGRIIEVRRQHRVKLPDAIIVATVLQYGAVLVTEDQERRNIPTLNAIGVT